MAKKFQNSKKTSTPSDIDRKMQPQAIDLEISVLGSILIDNEALSDSIDILKKELAKNKEQAQNLYQKSGEDLKIAILMGKREMSYDGAKKTLLKNKGSLSKSLNQDG